MERFDITVNIFDIINDSLYSLFFLFVIDIVNIIIETYYTTKAVRGPITKINQSDRNQPNDPVLCPVFNLKSRCRTIQVLSVAVSAAGLQSGKRKLEIIQGGRPASVHCLTAIFPKIM